jgi:hypothetical protein
MKFKLLFLTALATLLGTAALACTDPGDENGNKKTDISGGVVHADTKKPLGNVIISAYSANKKEKVVQTDSHGNFSFDDLKSGTYKLVFEKEGFRKVTREKVLIRSDEGCQVNVELDELGGMLIMPGLLFTEYE